VIGSRGRAKAKIEKVAKLSDLLQRRGPRGGPSRHLHSGEDQTDLGMAIIY